MSLSRSRRRHALLALAVCAPTLGLAGSLPRAGAATGTPEWIRPAVAFTTTALDFRVPVNGGTQTCNVEADLYVPAGVSAANPAPAILTSNGFGGDKSSTGATASNASYAQQYARQGYVTLSYSGLGFGKSTCQIELDSREFDGQAGAALVDFLGGDTSKAFTAYTRTPEAWTGPYTTAPPVVLDKPGDPRVGMIGGSYGGENQFAVTAVSQKVDAIVPQITWNDLAYSLAPNNLGLAGQHTDGTAPVTQSLASPGVEKFEWVSLFFALGNAQVAMGNGGVPSTICPDFDAAACPAKVQMDAVGYPDATTTAFAQNASVGTYLPQLTHYDPATGDTGPVPVFLSQGQDDTLFNLREAVTTYKALQQRGNPVKMLWQQWGHSGGSVAGEADGRSNVPQLFDDLRYSAWFAKYLRGDTLADTGRPFEYYTPWLPSNGVNVTNPGTGTGEVAGTADTAQMSGAADFPVGDRQTLYLSGGTAQGTGSLVHDSSQVVPGTASFAVTPGTASSYTETSAVDQSMPVTDTAGTFAAFTSPPLAADADQVGSPGLTVNLASTTVEAAQSQPAGQLVVFAKLYDLSPSGTITLANRVISPTRVTDITKPVTINLPDVVHRYPAGDRLEVVLSSSDAAYKGNDTAADVSLVTDATHVNTLTVPFTDAVGAEFGPTATASLPEFPLPAAAGLLAAGLGVLTFRRRRRKAA